MTLSFVLFLLWSYFTLSRLVITVINFYSNSTLVSRKAGDLGLISILIPAKDESARILPLLESIAAQDYSNFEVIVLDDYSTDDTYERVAQFCIGKPKFRIVNGRSLPNGWLGKNYACHQLSKLAEGSYFLFIDADVRVNAGLFTSSVSRLNEGKLALLSLFPKQIMLSLGERLTIPSMYYLLFTLLPLPLVKGSPLSFISAACGQFMLFPKEGYQKYQWHERVKGEIVEDLSIAKKIKQTGLQVEAVLATELLDCRMYTSFEDSVQGFSRSLPYVFKNNALLALAFLTWSGYGPLYALFTGNYQLLAASSFLIITLVVLVSKMTNQAALRNVLLKVPQFVSLIWVFLVFGLKKTDTMWKGRPVFSR